MAWKVKDAPIGVHGKIYLPGETIDSDERPILDHHMHERHWESYIEPVASPKIEPAPKLRAIK